jgi:hypothetical protein
MCGFLLPSFSDATYQEERPSEIRTSHYRNLFFNLQLSWATFYIVRIHCGDFELFGRTLP